MALPTFREIPRDLADWDRFFRSVPVTPDPNTVSDSELQNNAVTTPKVADSAITTPKLSDASVTDVKLRNSGGCTVIGRSPNTSGNPSDIAIDTNNKFLVRRAGQLTGDTLQDSDIPASIARDTEVATAISDHVALPDPHAQYQQESEKNSANGYAGLNASSRTTKGVDATDDVVIDLATKGLVLKDTQGTPHYWRITISNAGALVITDVGTTKP